MLKPDIRSVMLDPDIGGGQSFVIVRRRQLRSHGKLVTAGGTTTRINALGSVQPVGVYALQQLPEADRSGEVIVIRTETPMQLGLTDATGDLLADEIDYNGGKYKILQLKNWGAWGMYVAYATKVGEATVV